MKLCLLEIKARSYTHQVPPTWMPKYEQNMIDSKRQAKVDGESPWGLNPRKELRQGRDAEMGTTVFPRQQHTTGYLTPMVIPENYTYSYSIRRHYTVWVGWIYVFYVLRNIYMLNIFICLYIYIYKQRKEKRGPRIWIWKKMTEFIRGFGGRKQKREMIQLYYNLKKEY